MENKTITITEKEYNTLVRRAGKYDELYEKIEDHQGSYNEEADEFISNESADLCSIGELVLDEMDLWK